MTDSSLLDACTIVLTPADPDLAARVLADVTAPDAAIAVLSGIFGSAPYLGRLARRAGDITDLISIPASVSIASVMRDAAALLGAPLADVHLGLRQLKARLHLVLAIGDAGGAISLETVMLALSDFADLAVQVALCAAARRLVDKGLLQTLNPANPIPGVFVLALGKLGGQELNYSSDIDITFYFDRAQLSLPAETDADVVLARVAQDVVSILERVDGDGYVFRCDLRLRPDPGSTPPAVSMDAALDYYETVGQNWERAAYIKARAIAGDRAAADRFLTAIRPFVWRRTLDYAAISDIHSIKRQIHAVKLDERLSAPGAHVKLGRGGIREIEFFAQTQQLILGGRVAALRAHQTCAALTALAGQGVVTQERADALIADYRMLRTLEHRLQMVEDEHTHTIPEDVSARTRIALFMGYADLVTFDTAVTTVLQRVNTAYAELFAEAEDLSTPVGSLVFTGVEDDPETLKTLTTLGFERTGDVSNTIRGWHHGRIPAMRSARAREVFTRLVPRLVMGCAETGAADTAFFRFADFFTRLSAGVQPLSLFLANPILFKQLLAAFVLGPRFARTLAQRPQTLDVLIATGQERGRDVGEAIAASFDTRALTHAADYEHALNLARRLSSEAIALTTFALMTGRVEPARARSIVSTVAETMVDALAQWALRDLERHAGVVEGRFAVIAMGSLGARDMTVQSDLDLLFVYEADADATSRIRGWAGETFYLRLGQRLITALSAPTEEGVVFEVDMNLRPSGRKGPIAVTLNGFADYYQGSAWTWERMALTRARVVSSTDTAFGTSVTDAIRTIITAPQDAISLRTDIADMHTRLTAAKPAQSLWDFKRVPGGLTDGDFIAQYLVLRYSADCPGLLATDTLSVLKAAHHAGLLHDADIIAAYSTQRDIHTIMAAVLEEGHDPRLASHALRDRLATAGGFQTFGALEHMLEGHQTCLKHALHHIVLT